MARILANGLNRLRPADAVVVENIGGAGGIVGMNTVAKAAPDGRTLLFSPSGNIVISPSLQPNLPYDAPMLSSRWCWRAQSRARLSCGRASA